MGILVSLILAAVVVNLLFTIAISAFLVRFASVVGKKIGEMQDAPPFGGARQERNMSDESGLVDIEGSFSYDPRFTNPLIEEN